MTGGGPVKQPTAKQDFHKLVESGLAALCLEYDVQLPQVPEIVSKIIQREGLAKLHHMLQLDNPIQKIKQFEALCIESHVSLPSKGPRLTKVQGKFQKIKDQQQQKRLISPDPSLFKLQPGYFCYEDGSPAQILTSFAMQANGILLATPEDAQNWMRAAVSPPADELGVYVMGAIQIPSNFKTLQVDAPAQDAQGRQVILHGTLIQFGQKLLQTTDAKQKHYEMEQIQIASVTIWKKDQPADIWEQITTAPVRTVQNLLSLEGLGGILGKPWGRVFHDKGISVEPHAATSIQFHAAFQVGPRFNNLLRRSGFMKIYICPKTEHGHPDPKWKVIWLPSTTSTLELESQANSIVGAAGLVTSRKGVGLRVDINGFETAWKKLRPDDDMPEVQNTKWTFKVSPLPIGITSEVLKQWASQNYRWAIKPIRSIGAKQWLLGSNEVPSGIITFNGQPLLIQQVADRGVRVASAISAGPKNHPQPMKQKETRSNPFRQGDPFMDPWTCSTAVSETSKPRLLLQVTPGLSQDQWQKG